MRKKNRSNRISETALEGDIKKSQADISLVTKSFNRSILIGVIFGVIASVSGLLLSYYFNLPSGPSMSLVATGIFILSFIVSKLRNPIYFGTTEV